MLVKILIFLKFFENFDCGNERLTLISVAVDDFRECCLNSPRTDRSPKANRSSTLKFN